MAMVQMPSRTSNTQDKAQEVVSEPDVSDSLVHEFPAWDMLDEEWMSDEPPLESDLHRDQIYLLLELMKWYWRNRQDIYCSGNTTVYYDPQQRTNRQFKGPDLYVVKGVSDSRSRNSWMVWREGGKYPNVVIELLSDSTAKVDRTTKKALYQDQWQLPEYFWFHPRTKEFQGFRLVNGRYEAIESNAAEQLWSDELGLFLGLHEGMLRLFTAEGALVLRPQEEEAMLRVQAQREKEAEAVLRVQAQREKEAEAVLRVQAQQKAQQAQSEKEEAQRQAQQERLQKERLAARLRQLGIDPDDDME
jgi:Uma2 family endonuclease